MMPYLVKNNAIEFYRFVFAVGVFMIHSVAIVGGGIPWSRGYIGVEFFFILSGFLLMKHFEKHTFSPPQVSAEKYNTLYLIDKIKRFFPLHAIAWICMCFISIGLYDNTWHNIITKGYPEFLLLQSFGFPSIIINGVVWYLSSLLLVTYCIGYLLSKKKDFFLYVIAPISIGAIYGYIAKQYGHLNVNNLGFFRAFADMSLGCLAYCLYNKFASSRINNKIVTTVFEAFALFVLLSYCAFNVYINDFLFSFICAFFIISVFSNSSYISKLLNNNCSMFLGKISLAFYLNQNVVKHLTKHFLFAGGDFSPFAKACILIILNLLFSWGVVSLIDLIKEKMSVINNKNLNKV